MRIIILMSVMTKPIFLINKYIQDNKDINNIKDKLYKEGIHMKHYEDSGLFMLYHKYEAPCTTTMQRECRSVVFDDKTFNLSLIQCSLVNFDMTK